MYRCQVCGAVAPPRTPSYSLVVETRERAYRPRPSAMPCLKRTGKRQLPRSCDHPDDPSCKGYDRGGRGREIVRELRVCAACKPQPRLPTA